MDSWSVQEGGIKIVRGWIVDQCRKVEEKVVRGWIVGQYRKVEENIVR